MVSQTQISSAKQDFINDDLMPAAIALLGDLLKVLHPQPVPVPARVPLLVCVPLCVCTPVVSDHCVLKPV